MNVNVEMQITCSEIGYNQGRIQLMVSNLSLFNLMYSSCQNKQLILSCVNDRQMSLLFLCYRNFPLKFVFFVSMFLQAVSGIVTTKAKVPTNSLKDSQMAQDYSFFLVIFCFHKNLPVSFDFFFRIFPSSYGIQEEVNYLQYDHHAWNKNKNGVDNR